MNSMTVIDDIIDQSQQGQLEHLLGCPVGSAGKSLG